MRYRIKTHQEQIKEMKRLQQSVENKDKPIGFFLVIFIILSFIYI